MNLQNHLEILRQCVADDNRAGFDAQMKILSENFTTPEDKEAINSFVRSELRKLIDETDAVLKEVNVRMQLEEISEMISLSYIAKKYFNRTRQWLYQRINGNMVNNKPARFTPEEVDILNTALQDISRKVGSINVSIQ